MGVNYAGTRVVAGASASIGASCKAWKLGMINVRRSARLWMRSLRESCCLAVLIVFRAVLRLAAMLAHVFN